MRFRSLRVQGWRCFANPLALEDFAPGLNVIHGPNGIGKSTLMNAIVRAFFERHDVKSESLRSLRPWGKSLSPQVTLDFDSADETFRIRKKFLEEAAAEIYRRQGDRWIKQSESRAADEFARNLLQGEESKKRKLDVQAWGLAQILWAPQGGMEIEQLSLPVREALLAALGAQTTSQESSLVEKKIAAAYEAIFTAGGKPRTGENASPVVKLEANLAQAEERVRALKERFERFETASRSIEDLRLRAEAAEAQARELGEQSDRLRAACERYAAISSAVENGRLACEAAEARAQRLKSRLEEFQRVRAEILALESSLAKSMEQRPALLAERERAESLVALREAEVQRVRARRGDVDRARSAAEAAARLTTAVEHIERLRRIAERLEVDLQEQAALKARRAETIAPSSVQITALRKADAACREANVRLEASLVRLTFTAEREIAVTRGGVPEATSETLAAGERIEETGLTQASLVLAGIGTVTASGPGGSAERFRAEAEEARAKWNKLSEPFGRLSLEELERRTEAAARYDRGLAEIEARIAAILDRRTIEEIREELALREAERRDLLAREPSWERELPSAAAAAASAERLEREFHEAIDRAERERRAAQADAEAIVQRLMVHETEASGVSLRLGSIRARYDELRSDGLDDARRAAEYDEALLAFHASRAALEAESKKLAEFAGDPRRDAAALAKRSESQRAEGAKTNEALHREDERLRQLAEEAPYSKLAGAEEQAAHVREELNAARLKSEAVKLLHETLVQVRSEGAASLADPIERRALATLRRIGGGKFEELSLDEALVPSGVVSVSGGRETRAIEELSGGEREQLHFAARLALAEIAFGNERRPLVLDDVFVYTDSVRLSRAVNILEETAERFQILLLTCHPERYRSLREAKFYDLEDLVRSSELSA